MKEMRIVAMSMLACLIITIASCSENTDDIGGSLRPGEVDIQIDSLFTVTGESDYCPVFDAKSPTELVGHINVPEYGDLECSFVTQMLSATQLNVPDSVPVENVDSLKLRLRFANGNLTGDSLAPQQIKVFSLNKQLPADITNEFDPEGYYNPSTPLGVRPYTGSALGMNDDVFNKSKFRSINVPMPLDMAKQIFTDYREKPAIFQSVAAFNEYFPGIFVQHTFGRGMVVNITSTDMMMYYHTVGKTTSKVNGVTVERDTMLRDSLIIFNVSPEIISSNRIKLQVAQSLKDRVENKEAVLVSPAGYNVKIKFPGREIVSRYKGINFDMGVINALTMSIPVEEIANNYDIGPAPYLLMVPTAKMQEFFASNSIPDDITSFYAPYNSTTHSYDFMTLRNYILSLMSKDEISDEDVDFTLVPVSITTEKADPYGNTISVSTCVPYMNRPSMCVLKLGDAKVRFVYSTHTM